jgi:hypothetical protein
VVKKGAKKELEKVKRDNPALFKDKEPTTGSTTPSPK